MILEQHSLVVYSYLIFSLRVYYSAKEFQMLRLFQSTLQIIDRFSWLLFISAIFNILTLKQAIKGEAYTLVFPLIEAFMDVVLLAMAQYPFTDEFVVHSFFDYMFGKISDRN